MWFTGTHKSLGIATPEFGYFAALAKSMNPNVGTEIGDYIYCEDCCAEILNKNETQYELCALGWVDKSKCRFVP